MLHLKLVNATDKVQAFALNIVGGRPGSATGQSLHATDNWATNTIDQPNQIVPTQLSGPHLFWILHLRVAAKHNSNY